MTTNTHIAAQREAFEAWYCADAQRQGVEIDSIASLREDDGYGAHRHMLNGKWQGWQAALQSAQALEAVPALDAQGEAIHQYRVKGASDWYDGHPDWIDGKSFETRTLYSTPLPHAVGKPLSDEQRKQITAMWNAQNRNYTVSDIIDAVEAAHGIVTKEAGNG